MTGRVVLVECISMLGGMIIGWDSKNQRVVFKEVVARVNTSNMYREACQGTLYGLVGGRDL